MLKLTSVQRSVMLANTQHQRPGPGAWKASILHANLQLCCSLTPALSQTTANDDLLFGERRDTLCARGHRGAWRKSSSQHRYAVQPHQHLIKDSLVNICVYFNLKTGLNNCTLNNINMFIGFVASQIVKYS